MVDNDFKSDLPDYKDDADAYEIEERSRPDEMIMLKIAGETASEVLDNLKDAAVLDLCCGTGLSLERIVEHPNASYIVGVDISRQYLEFAQNKYANLSRKPIFIHGDVVHVSLPRDEWDVIMMASAYHHIEDDRKIEFLRRVSHLLGSNGYAIFAENILPEYEIGNGEDYARAVRFFYQEVLKTAKDLNPNIPDHVVGLISRVAKYGIDGDYEYKVCRSVFLNHLEQVGLQIVMERKVWPKSGPLSETTGGNYVLKVRNYSKG